MWGLGEVGAKAELVSHRAGEDEEGCRFAEEAGEAGFEAGGGGGFEVDIIAEGGGGEGAEHGRSGGREGVGAEIEGRRGGAPAVGLRGAVGGGGCHCSSL